jgi:hypothetical protein
LVISLNLLAVSWTAKAVSPPPDGGYPNQNTAEGTDALLNVNFGSAGLGDNTAIGFDALTADTTGIQNTAVGSEALFSNTTGNDNTAEGKSALINNTLGSSNTAVGIAALGLNRHQSHVWQR